MSEAISLNEAADAYYESPNDDTLQRVIEAAEGYVCYFRKLYGASANRDDLYQAGMEGLLKALRDYQPNQGARFATYAGYRIMGEIRHWVRKESAYRRPGCIISLQFKVDAIIEKYLQENGQMPQPETIAAMLDVKPESISEIMRAGLVSFDEIEAGRIRSTAYHSFELPIEDRLFLAQIRNGMSELQQRIWDCLFVGKKTQEQTAQTLGMTQKQVSREKIRMARMLQDELREELLL